MTIQSPPNNGVEEEYLPTHSSLIKRLKSWEDHESWQCFFNTYWKLIYCVAIKAGLSDDEAQEVVQNTVIAVAKGLPDYRYDPAVCSFKSWLMLLTRRRIIDHLRKRRLPERPRRRREDDSNRTDTVDRIPDPASLNLDSVWEEEWAKNLVDVALQRMRQLVSDKQYQIFDLYVVKEWSARDVARTLHVSLTQVYLAKHRISALLKKEMKQLERKVQ